MIPFTFNQLTVRQYQSITEILDSEADLLDKQTNIIAFLLKKTVDEVEQLPLSHFQYYASQITFLKQPNLNTKVRKYIWLRGRLFKGVTDLEKLSTGQYIDLKEFAKEGKFVENFHKMLACVYKPVFPCSFDKACELFKDAKMGKVSGLLFFYSNELERLSPFILTYSKQAAQTIQEVMEEMKSELEAL